MPMSCAGSSCSRSVDCYSAPRFDPSDSSEIYRFTYRLASNPCANDILASPCPLAGKPATLHPVFAGARNVGGADGDLIVDGCLWDIKTTTQKAQGKWLFQLLGYDLLDNDDDRFGLPSVPTCCHSACGYQCGDEGIIYLKYVVNTDSCILLVADRPSAMHRCPHLPCPATGRICCRPHATEL